jgi:iron complex outermembrane receptor protein
VKKLILLCSTAVVMPTAAFAQSTGTQEFEKETIVVTGTRTQAVGGVQAPDTSKAKAVLTQEYIARQNPGQTVLDTINAVPGVSFQNNDAYGSSGGTLTIRGFSSDRISLTFDGIQLNDSGNYAIFSNQQIDPERHNRRRQPDGIRSRRHGQPANPPAGDEVRRPRCRVNWRVRLPPHLCGDRYR